MLKTFKELKFIICMGNWFYNKVFRNLNFQLIYQVIIQASTLLDFEAQAYSLPFLKR